MSFIDRILGRKAEPEFNANSLFKQVLQAGDRDDFHRLSLRALLESYSAFVTENPVLLAVQEGLIIKRPRGLDVEKLDEDIGQSRELEGDTAVLLFGHGKLGVGSIRWLENQRRGVDVTIGRWSNSPTDQQSAREKADELTHEFLNLDTNFAQNLSGVAESVQYRFPLAGPPGNRHSQSLWVSHDQCGANSGNFSETLGQLLVVSHEVIRQNAPQVLPLIELRGVSEMGNGRVEVVAGGMVISPVVDRLKKGRVVLRIYSQDELKEQLQKNGFGQAVQIHCVDENFPFLAGSQLGERAYEYNRYSRWDKIIREQNRRRISTGAHQVGYFALLDKSNAQSRLFAEFLMGGAQVVSRAGAIDPYRGVGDSPDSQNVVNRSGAIVYLDDINHLKKHLATVAGLYPTAGSGYFQEGDADTARGLATYGSPLYPPNVDEFERSVLKIRQPTAFTGVVIGGNTLADSVLVQTNQSDPPRAPIVIVDQRLVNQLGENSILKALKAGSEAKWYEGIYSLDLDRADFNRLYQDVGSPRITGPWNIR